MGGLALPVIPPEAHGELDVQIRFRVDRALDNRIEAVCKETGRKQSDIVRYLILAGLEQYEKEKHGKK